MAMPLYVGVFTPGRGNSGLLGLLVYIRERGGGVIYITAS
jgi:hypothetical protein